LVGAVEHSPLVRSRETARLVKAAAKARQPLRTLAGLEPEADPRATADLLARARSSRLLVGHNPHLAALAGKLLGLREGEAGIHFRKAAMLVLERLAGPSSRQPYGVWRLKAFLPPPAGK